MKGYISKISGPTIHAEIQGLKLYELVFIGNKKLIGEVVKLKKNKAIIQIYEETKGLSIGETVTASGKTALCYTGARFIISDIRWFAETS